MNQEKLTKLVNQASTVTEHPDRAGHLINFNAEKFAELIIQECVGLVEDSDNAYDILKYFEVI